MLLATNTSSISVTRLASVTDRPGKFIGLHFMNPVPVMKLVEIIRGIATDEETFRTVRTFVQALGKKPVNAEDFPAFIVNRILLPMINEAIYTLYEGVGNVEAIDTGMKLGANHPMGPLELADFIGLDTCLSVMQVLHEGLADSKYRPCPLLVKYVEAGWVGKKATRSSRPSRTTSSAQEREQQQISDQLDAKLTALQAEPARRRAGGRRPPDPPRRRDRDRGSSPTPSARPSSRPRGRPSPRSRPISTGRCRSDRRHPDRRVRSSARSRARPTATTTAARAATPGSTCSCRPGPPRSR